MRLLGLITVLIVALTSPAETLRDVLKSNGVPESAFSRAELDGSVNAAAAAKNNRVLVVYLRLDNNGLIGNPQLVQFKRDSGALVRSGVKPEDEDRCCGSPDGVEFVGDFAILSFHINPSAATMLVLDKDLKLVTTLYGFDVREVVPGQLLFIENMIHFAPVHPERLQLADLRTGKRMELYPPRGDALRAEFAREHAKHMPPPSTCMQMNDPCKPELYDETVEFVDTDRGGNFVFTVHREALHAMVIGQPPESVGSETAFYRYAWNGRSWMYCEQKLTADQVARYKAQGHHENLVLENDCTPALPVVADTSNAQFSPFDRHDRN